ncbi:hypothetical protein SETIT_6G175900v2 [Setaria italica]|uniref:C2H2-type domain-containing protein n=1 Tax=Setaria italica TaxID=4555 RepID=A0A368RMT3_SETIT|nr:hypothetical protein SETIT_6G175900v2 [Setaria italica]
MSGGERDAHGINASGGSKVAASIDSFSQLPFIRSAREKQQLQQPATTPGGGTAGIRLFGFDVPPDSAAAAMASSTGSKGEAFVKESPAAAAAETSRARAARAGREERRGAAGSRVPLLLLLRNFPTSQALGGHQNAHKRERQHAKRAQFQTAMAMHHGQYYYPHHHPAAVADPAHLYPAALAAYHHHRFAAAPPPHYPSWAAAGGRYYSGPGSISQPINGSPVATPPPPALWRVPTGGVGVGMPLATRRQEEATPPPLAVLGGEEQVVVGGSGSAPFSPSTSSSSSSASPHKRPAPPERKENDCKHVGVLD